MLTDVEPCVERCPGEPGSEVRTVVPLPLAEVFRRYLDNTPLAYAVFRAAEARQLASVEIAKPVLDVGCSVGEFSRYAILGQLDVGVDLLADRLAVARNAKSHQTLAQADAARLPLGDESVASVLAVSVCEHFAQPRAALAEAYRVLQPKGRFVATIVLSDLHRHLFYPWLLRRLGLGCLAPLYLRLHDSVFAHRVLESQTWWERRLTEAGFRVLLSRKIVAPRLTAWFDFWLATAWPYRIWQRFGRPRVWRPRWFVNWCWKHFQRLDTEDEEGSVLFVVAEKADEEPIQEAAGRPHGYTATPALG